MKRLLVLLATFVLLPSMASATTLTTFNDSSTAVNVSFLVAGSNASAGIKLPQSATVSSALMNITGLSQSGIFFSSGWTKKANITINSTNTLNLTDYQVLLNVSYDSDMQSDFDDLRFTYLNSTGEYSISHWIENYTSTFADVWINVPNISGAYTAANTTVYMYYGNPSATNQSNGNNTFLFFDDFSTDLDWTNKWQSTSQGSYTTSGGLLSVGSVDAFTKVLNSKTAFNNFIAEARIKTSGPQFDFGTDSSAANHGHTEDIQLLVDVACLALINGNQNQGGAVTAGTWYRGKIVIPSSETAAAYLYSDDLTSTHVSKTGTPSSRTEYVSFVQWGGNTGGVDWVRVRKYASTEPTYTIKSEETALYPTNATVNIGNDNSVEWAFNGTGYGSLGHQTTFNDSSSSKNISFSASGYNTSLGIRLPKTAFVSSATMDVTGFSSGGGGSGSILWTTNGDFNRGTYTNTSNSSNNLVLGWNVSGGAFMMRRNITINSTNTLNLTDYQMLINVTYDSDMQSDYDDLRFTYLNSTGEYSIPHWIENQSSSLAQVWVKVPNITGAATSTNTTLYMYYGNPSVSSESNGNNTFVYFDDFESGIGAWTNQSGNWQQTSVQKHSGSYSVNQTGPDAWANVFYLTASSIRDSIAQAWIRTAQYGAGVFLRYHSLSNSGYLAFINTGPAPGRFSIYRRNNGTDSEITFGSPTITVNTWYKVEFNVSGTVLRAKLYDSTGSLLSTLSATDSTHQGANKTGVFLYGSSGGIGYVDDFFARKHANITPTFAVLGKETAKTGSYTSNTTNIGTPTSLTATWNSSLGWTKKRNITINSTNTLNLTNYQVLLNVSYDSDMQSDFDDLRFTYLNKTGEYSISHWIENYTSSFADVWVKVPNVTGAATSTNTTLYMYYGNPSATYNNTLGGINTFIFYDDFNRNSGTTVGNGWTEIGTKPGIDSSRLYSGGDASQDCGVYRSAAALNDIVIESDIYWNLTGTNYAVLLTKATGASWATGYGAGSRPNYATYQSIVIDNGGVPNNTATPTMSTLTWYKVEIRINGMNYLEYKAWQKGALKPSSPSISYDVAPASAGTNWVIGTGGDLNTIIALFDNYFIRKYALKDPTFAFKDPEENTKTDYLNTTDIKIELSTDGSTWLIAENNTEYTSGYGSGSNLRWRANFSTNDTNLTPYLHDLTVSYQSGGYPTNVSIINISNISQNEWSYAGELNSTNSPQTTANLSSMFNRVLSTCTATTDSYGNQYCNITLNISSATAGIVNISSINIYYTYRARTNNFTSIFASLLPACSCSGCSISGSDCTIPINVISNSSGTVELSDLYIVYTTIAGDVITRGYVLDSKTGALLSNVNVTALIQETGGNSTETSAAGDFTLALNSTLVSGRWYTLVIKVVDSQGRNSYLIERFKK